MWRASAPWKADSLLKIPEDPCGPSKTNKSLPALGFSVGQEPILSCASSTHLWVAGTLETLFYRGSKVPTTLILEYHDSDR